MRWRLAAGLAAIGTALVVIVVLLGAGNGDAPAPAPVSADVSAVGALAVRVDDPRRARRVPPGFLGLSIEFQAVRAYTGPDPGHINPVLVALIRNLTPGQAPVLRIGGDSTDAAWLPGPGVRRPGYVTYPLTRGWLATTGALARSVGAHMTMGINLAANQPALAAAEARAFARALGPGRLTALEIGNEPDVYGKIAGLEVTPGHFRRARPRQYDYRQFARQFIALARRVPGHTLWGPALAAGPTYDPGTWIGSVGGLLGHLPRLRVLTVHRYPLRNCYVPPRSPQYPSIPHLLAPYAVDNLAASLRRWLRVARAHGRALRVDELNSAACRGKAGVSDTFASALWVTDALFALASEGVAGVNLHTLPDSAYELFHFTHRDGRWSAYVQPVYYGAALFSRAAPPGSRLLPTSANRGTGSVRVWATRAADGVRRAVIVNESPTQTRTVSLTMPAGTTGTATVTRLRAPSVSSHGGVTWGGQSYGPATTRGTLAAPQTTTLSSQGGAYTLSVPHGSAALITFPR